MTNPYRPGAGHPPPHLAGRKVEQAEFRKLLKQTTIMQNLVLTGLRGLGKTVLLDTFKPLAVAEGWGWVGTDLSESASVTEEHLANRLLADLAVVTAPVPFSEKAVQGLGFGAALHVKRHYLTFEVLRAVYEAQPGLVVDKLKAVFLFVHAVLKRRLVFAYDEAQNLADHAEKDQFPLSLLLELFQSIQRQNVPFMLVLTGLPTLFPKLVEARTYAERMFHVLFLDRLSKDESREAVSQPLSQSREKWTDASIESIIKESGGYPYFIQFICREVFDLFEQQAVAGKSRTPIPLVEITQKLDTDFFAGRWSRLTDRQREFVACVAALEGAGQEFTVQEIVEYSKRKLSKGFSASHTSQILSALAEAGLVYKNRHGKYAFAVPLFDRFVRRQSLLD